MSETKRSVTVDLAYPFEHEGREVKSLSFRRMKAKDALVAEGETNQAKAGYLLYAALAGVDVQIIEELDIEDLEKIGEAIIPLMGKSAAAAMDKQKKASSPYNGAT
ncbi:MAG TPA: phage tail assembly protein [Devosia sp.]|jgi:hypothetical protein|nr:phage tail assembly protein [Devosia sp.]